MKTFHIIFKDNDSDFMSKGENFRAVDIIQAYGMFLAIHPMAVFIALYHLEALAEMKGYGKTKEDIIG